MTAGTDGRGSRRRWPVVAGVLVLIAGAVFATRLVTQRRVASGWQAIEELKATTDEGYIYLMLRTGGQGRKLDWARVQYRIAIDTYDPKRGERELPGPMTAKIPTGAEFLLELAGPKASSLKVSSRYDPYPYNFKIDEGARLESPLKSSGKFVPLKFEPNRERFGRDGTRFPARVIDRGALRFGSTSPKARDFDSRADVAVGETEGLIEIRIPWNLLNVGDPSSRRVLHGVARVVETDTIETDGFRFYVYSFDPKRSRDPLVDQLPRAGRKAPLFLWPKWEEPKYRLEKKQGAVELEQVIKAIPDFPERKAQ